MQREARLNPTMAVDKTSIARREFQAGMARRLERAHRWGKKGMPGFLRGQDDQTGLPALKAHARRQREG